jgi:ABC-type lipoprotein export system ATPase subunit
MALFFKLREELNQTFVIVTHNEQLAQMADRILEIKDGLIVLNRPYCCRSVQFAVIKPSFLSQSISFAIK